MPSLTIRDLPDETILSLKTRAAHHHRSLNGEILHIFSTVALFGDSFEFPVRPGSESPEEKQRAAVLELAGKWIDSRPLEATIADIEGARTPGREVAL